MWTTPQRAVILAIVLGVFVYLCTRFAFQYTYISNPQPLDGSRAAELADRLDPNIATQAQLAAIPGVGEKLAATVLEFRERYVRENSGKLAFSEPRDLLRVRGIGAARMDSMKEYLMFPLPRAATRP